MATIPSTQPTYRPSYSNNVHFEDGNLLTGILVTLIFLTVATSLDAAGHVASMTLLIPITLGAALLAVLMSYSRFDGFFALSHSMFTGLAWILLFMAGIVKETEIRSFLDFGIPELQARVYFVLWKLLNWVDAALNNKASNDNYVFIFEISFLVWWLTYLGVWAIFRYGITWRSIMPSAVVMLINTYYAPKPVVGFLIFFCLVSLLFLVRTNLAEQQKRWRERQFYFNQDIVLDFLRNGLIYSVLVLAIAWQIPDLGRNAYVRQLMSPINATWEDANARMTELYKGLNYQRQQTAAAFGRTLSLGGERTVENLPVFTVSTTAGRYWRAVTFDTYVDGRWLNTLKEESRFAADAILPVSNWGERTTITQTFTLLAPTGNVIFGAPDILRVSEAIEVLAQPAAADALMMGPPDANNPVPMALDITFARSRRTLERNESYSVISYLTTVTRRAMEEAGTVYPAVILEKYLQLPEDFSPRVAQTAITVTAGLETPYAKAKALETFLRTYTYDDAIPAPPAGVDPVEYFLYELRRGYCDYYATAMVLMLRHLGIPARTASGYAEGTFDEETGAYFVTDQDAHTWVEVFFPNLGWVEFEPTAGESPLNRPEGDIAADIGMQPGPTPVGTPGNLGGPLPDNIQDELMNQAVGTALAGSTGNQTRWWLWAIVALAGLALGLVGLRRSQVFGPTAFTPELPPLLYERLQRWGERLGLRTRPSDTPYEQAHTFGRALPDGQPFIAEITENYVRYRFGRQNELGVQEAAGSGLVRAWQGLHPLLWRAWGRKVFRFPFGRRKGKFSLVRE